MANVLNIPDLHAPFEHKDALAFVKEVRRKFKTTETVCSGDEGDAHHLSQHDHDPDGLGAKGEWEAMIEHLRPFYEAFPVCRSMVSNHTARPYRMANKFGLPSVYLREYRDFMDAPRGWSWHESIEIDNVRYLHGEGFSGPLGALKCAQAHMQTVVIGHLHSFAGVLWSANPKHLFAGCNAGCLIDRKAYAFAYAKNSPTKPILGCAVVIDGIPQFIPMQLTAKGGWTGDL